MKIKTSELTGTALDWAVAKCSGITNIGQPEGVTFHAEFRMMHDAGDFNYSTDWAQGGPIIEREKVSLEHRPFCWLAYYRDASTGESNLITHGDTPLTAAMRCYVASKLGDEVEIPEELK